jgi:tRNA 5-methylaminomethyl-2-thiouridine biosynthesis bifunctional protein
LKTAPIVPAEIRFDGVPTAPVFGDVYHPREGAYGQANHVFLRGNRLPERWRGRQRFVVLETGFGLGHNFLALWNAWRSDPERPARLHLISIDKHPPRREDLARAHAAAPYLALSAALLAQWPPLVPNMHRLLFEGGAVDLLLAFGDAAAWMREIVAEVDAFFLDGFAPARNPEMWSRSVLAPMARLAAAGATAATWSVAREVRDELARAGFEVKRASGFGPKREMTVARFAPRFRARPPPGRSAAMPGARDALVIGAGLAGAAAAAELTAQGLACTVLDAAAQPASAASGNPGGLFRGIVNRDDGPHARLLRAAAIEAARVYRPLIDGAIVPGAQGGVLQLGDEAQRATRWPADYVRSLDSQEASVLAGLRLSVPALHFPGGGWLKPRALVEHWLGVPAMRFVGSSTVARVARQGDRWVAFDAAQHVLGSGDVVVIANAAAAVNLAPELRCTLGSTRGQITRLPSNTPGLNAPRLPLASKGYVITLENGDLLVGATSSADGDPSPRPADDLLNLRTLERLTGAAPSSVPPGATSRTGWRCRTDDRLPLAGAAPLAAPPPQTRIDLPRFVPREPGLFVLTALGSRGITWAPLCARVLAAAVTGAPMPLEASLLDAIDAARYASRS